MSTSPNVTIMTTVKCNDCGAQFEIAHRMAMQDVTLAQKQAAWLTEKFVWDHIQENKHRGSIELPSLSEIK